ncbi:hypothetical protein EXIGLDRAFT_724164 [Exidia glandulosa HHB12029]|uniref:F-box domain-containing protein n=1 Tax=Exidia glandulosa HHB12029 TaxID=1314781 RepID=A0A165EIL4_EXIGL|nr:hypothetical protein EXIGLDRAFT_724164 [Exidia glandulosa HHB12029]
MALAKISLLRQHLHHAHGLCIVIPQGPSVANLWQRVMAILRTTRAPILQVFGLVDQRRAGFVTGTASVPVLPRDLFAGYAPHLHTLAIVNVLLPHHPYPAFQALRTIRVQMDGLGAADYMRSTSTVDWLNDVGKFLPQEACYPELQHLDFATNLPLTPGIPAHKAVLENLECLIIADFDGIENLHRFLLAHPQPTRLHIYNAGGRSSVDWLFDSQTPVFLRVLTEYFCFPNPQHLVETRNDAGHTRQVKFNPANHAGGQAFMSENQRVTVLTGLIKVPIVVFADLTSLVIHERYWPPTPVTAPNLVDLTIFILQNSGEQCFWPGYKGLVNGGIDAQHRWIAPGLKSVTFAVPRSHGRFRARSHVFRQRDVSDYPLEARWLLLVVGIILGFSPSRPLELLRVKRMTVDGEDLPGSMLTILQSIVRRVEAISVNDEPDLPLSIADDMSQNVWFYTHWEKLFT